MKTPWTKIPIVFTAALLIAGCSPKLYRPPALGAEYQFDRGLPPAKKPSHLFDPKAEKELIEKGMLPGERSHKATTTAPKATTRTPDRPDSSKTASPEPKPATDHNTTLIPPERPE